ncbi:MAG: hypothetical protein AAF824_02650 [Bacteroidota bacterium]
MQVFFAIALQYLRALDVPWTEAGWQWALIMLAYLTVFAYLNLWST